jgi:hypothetical protein
VGSQAGERHNSSQRDDDEPRGAASESGSSASGPDMSSGLPADFAQRCAVLKHMMHQAQNRSLTLGELQAIELLVQSLRELLGPDEL